MLKKLFKALPSFLGAVCAWPSLLLVLVVVALAKVLWMVIA